MVWFGEFPEVQGIPRQIFDVFTAFIGLAAFAIVLALIEQVIYIGIASTIMSLHLEALTQWIHDISEKLYDVCNR